MGDRGADLHRRDRRRAELADDEAGAAFLAGNREGTEAQGEASARFVLDIETEGFGEVGGAPRQVLACVRWQGGCEAFWGSRATVAGLRWALRKAEAEGKRAQVWAHYGGGFDFRFALPWLLKKARKARIVTVGSIVLQAIGEFKSGERFDLRDSIRLLPAGLGEIGAAMDLPKLGQDMQHRKGRGCRCVRCEAKSAAGRKRLRAYCERDCEILWQALAKAERQLAKVGVEGLRTTLASCAAYSVRSRLAPEEQGYTPHGERRGVADVDGEAERANFGGRVEVIREHAADTASWDIRSAYVHAMLAPLPWRYKGPCRDLPAHGFAVCDVEVPEDTYLPALPWRSPGGPDAGRIYFPTGRWRGAFAAEELRAAIDTGAARINRGVSAHAWEPSTALRDFAERGWAERRAAVGFDRFFWKRILVSLYGKTVEQREKEMICVDDGRSMAGYTRVARGLPLMARPVYYQPKFRNVIVGASITARTRVALRAWALRVLAEGGRIYYFDTDNLVTSGAELPTGDELGDLDCQARIASARFVAPKCYTYTTHEGKIVTRAKGLPSLSPEAFAAMAAGDPVRFERSEGIRESMRNGRTKYRRVEVTRSRHVERRGKRAPDGEGTRPWTISELLDGR